MQVQSDFPVSRLNTTRRVQTGIPRAREQIENKALATVGYVVYDVGANVEWMGGGAGGKRHID